MRGAEADINPEFNKLVVHHVDAMYKIAYAKVGNADDAQDIVQDTFIKALVAFRQLRSGDNAKNWLTKILVNNIRDFYRIGSRRASTVAFDEGLNDPESPKPNPEEQLIDAEIDPSLQIALSSMSEQFVLPLLLREVHDASYVEISQILDIPLGTVMSRLSRARSQLRRKIAAIQKSEVERFKTAQESKEK